MSNAQKSIELKNVEQVIEHLIDDILPIKSLTVINDVSDGEIVGGVGDIEQFQSLAQGVTYIVIGLGKLPGNYDVGINFIDLPKGKNANQ